MTDARAPETAVASVPAAPQHERSAYMSLPNPGTLAPASATDIRYTVVVPSRNRQRYAVEAAQSVLAAGRDDVQVIIADNSDDAAVMPRLLERAGVLDRVLLLGSLPKPLTMKDNWERTLDYCAGEWISFIGDDDGFLVDAFDALDFLTTAYKTHVVTWRPMYYKWPCFPECDRGTLTVPYTDVGVTFLDAMNILQSHVEWVAEDKWPHAGPSIYHGAVHRDIITVTRIRYGRYFMNSIVDYSCAITNCTFIDNFIQYHWPITIMGACGDSNTAGLTARGSGKRKIDQLREENRNWRAVYPEFEETRLMAPWVAAGYLLLLEELGLPFQMTPSKFAKSCINELGRVRDPETFAAEQTRLVAFMRAHGLDTAKAEALRCVPTMAPTGWFPKPDRVMFDTSAFGWTGILDVATKLRALRSGFAQSTHQHAEMLEKTRNAAPQYLRDTADDAYKALGRVAARMIVDLEITPLQQGALVIAATPAEPTAADEPVQGFSVQASREPAAAAAGLGAP